MNKQLSKRYYTIGRINPTTEITEISITSCSGGAYLSETGKPSIFLNTNALRKLYDILKMRFNK